MAIVKHFSHRHELCSFQVQEEDDEIIICSGCDLELRMNSGTSAYKCSKSKCEFYLHGLCFELPRQIKHKSHPQHPLILISTPPYEYGEFKCDACAGFGSNCFAFHCVHCKYDLHLQCAALPETLSLQHHHQHTLTLLYSSLPPNHENDRDKQNICHLCQRAAGSTAAKMATILVISSVPLMPKLMMTIIQFILNVQCYFPHAIDVTDHL